jgi:hypothetical protein
MAEEVEAQQAHLTCKGMGAPYDRYPNLLRINQARLDRIRD